jgi:hypothetical protein
MRHARGDQHRAECHGPRAIGSGSGGSQQPAETLATAKGCGTAEITRRAGVSKILCVALARAVHAQRPAARENQREPGLPPMPPGLVDRVVALTLSIHPARRHWQAVNGDG